MRPSFDMRDIHRIVCPLDFSDASYHAVDHAVAIAEWYGAYITALHVAAPVSVPRLVPAGVGGDDYELSERANLDLLREDIGALFKPAAGSGVDVSIRISHGSPAADILECARTESADLLVMGTHGAGGFEHLVLGSVVEKVLRRATCPVLTVPPRARATSTLPFTRILCPVDFSPASVDALQFALSLAQEGDASLTLLHTLEWPDDVPLPLSGVSLPDYTRDREDEALRRLQGLVPDSSRLWCRPIERITHGKAYREILGVAAEDNVDLIVMGVQGRNALDVMLFGSTTNQVVRRATCPVLTVRT